MIVRNIAHACHPNGVASIDEICRIAHDSGWKTLEPRVSDEESIRIGLDDVDRASARDAFQAAGLRICCLACTPGSPAELDSLGYQGCLSLEWERRWHSHAAPLPGALVQTGAWLGAYGQAV